MSQATVFCMASVKGGAGKTVLAATFGTVLAALGKRVLLVDTDAATNGLTLLYLDEVMDHRDAAGHDFSQVAGGTYEIPGANYRQPSVLPLSENLSLLPATYRLFNSESVEIDLYEQTLAVLVEDWRSEYDFIFLDAQAGSDGFAHSAMRPTVSDKVILVTEYDPLSAAGVERMKALFPEDLTYDRTWVLLNKMLPDIATKYGEFLEIARYLPPVPWTADVVRAYSRRSLALDLRYGNEYTVSVCKTLGGLLDKRSAEELRGWLETKAAELRTPIDTKVRDLKLELQKLRDVELASKQLEQRRSRTQLVVTSAMLSVLLALMLAGLTVLNGAIGNTVFFAASLFAAALLFLGRDTMVRIPSPPRAGSSDTGLSPAESARLQARLRHFEKLSELDDEELLANRSRGT